MKSGKRSALRLEALEDRWVPATVSYSGGNLTVSSLVIRPGAASSVTITESASGDNFTVMDGAGNNGTYAVTGNITVNGGTTKDVIALNLSATGLLGNFSSTTSAASTVTVDGNTGVVGEIRGTIGITLGTGGGTVNLGTTNGLTALANVTASAGASSASTLIVGNATTASTFRGTMDTFTNFPVTTLGGSAADEFLGTVSVNYSSNPNAGTNILNAKILGNYTVTGGGGGSSVTINSGAEVVGTLAVNVTGATDSLTLSATGTATTTIGTLNFTSSNGNTTFTASGATADSVIVNNNVTLNWGTGTNSFGSTAGFYVGGSMEVLDSVNAGGSLNVSSNPFEGYVQNNLTVYTGNGNNSFELDGNGTANVLGMFYYSGGNGGNSVTVTTQAGDFFDLDLKFGTSPGTTTSTEDDFTIGTGAGTGWAAGTITGSASWANPPGAGDLSYFQPNGYVFTNPWTSSNTP